jgi:hypothetical protein
LVKNGAISASEKQYSMVLGAAQGIDAKAGTQ